VLEPDQPEPEHLEEFVDPVDGTRWLVDLEFLRSNWTCIWGRGCEGILDRPAPELGQGCCSVGAELLDEDEARTVGALGLTLDPSRFQFHVEATAGGVLDAGRRSTRVVDGACIFLNRSGFAGGSGCALHLAALDEGESSLDWKPSVCWQLPLKVERRESTSGEEAGAGVLRRWRRSDWGAGGAAMAWCCTEAPAGVGTSAYVGDRPVAEALFGEVQALVGPEVAVAIRTRAGADRAS
jgi:hypothetical protein